jgi:hypothetical protein
MIGQESSAVLATNIWQALQELNLRLVSLDLNKISQSGPVFFDK